MGAVSSFISESWPPKSHFNVEDIPDLSGKVVIVTGGYSGVGKETVKALLSHNATVYLAGRSKDKAEEAIKELKETSSNEPVFLQLDLASLASVRQAAEEFLSKEKKLHVLFNNAGVMYPPVSELTTDGYDLQFGTNVIGPFYFTTLLLPALFEGAKDSADGKARVVTTSSIGHTMFPAIDYETLVDTPKRQKLSTHNLYCQTKLANIMFARELAKRFADQGIVSTSCNPGNLRTNLQRYTAGMEKKILFWLCHPPALGALTQLWAGTSPETVDFNGKYLIPWARVGQASKAATNDGESEKLWNWLDEQIQKAQSS
ncbi:NAD(P)-binding protein [Phellopilus nigrolimitatus]|nr:NAD(P)-binding protein [Phellopilus nigrolimitatus]